MFASFSRSWELSKQSWNVLKSDKQLLFLPLLSSLACFAALCSFALPIALTIDWSQLQTQPDSVQQASRNPLYYVVTFAFYFVNYTVIAFFNAALIACAMRKFNGEDASISAGLRVAVSRLPQILGWALVAATVGMVLRANSERSGLLGKIVIGLVGFVWTIATYFVVPVLVVEGVGPIEAVKRSTGIMRKTWGETLVANIGLGALSFLGFLLALTPLGVGLALTISTQSAWPVAIGGALMVVMLISLALVTSTLQMIIVAALYRFASTGLIPEHFDGQLLRQAFRQKN